LEPFRNLSLSITPEIKSRNLFLNEKERRKKHFCAVHACVVVKQIIKQALLCSSN
jgi:hypothetical protein